MERLTDEELDKVEIIYCAEDSAHIISLNRGHTEELGERIAQAQLDKDIASNQQAYEIGVSDGKVEGVAEGIREVVEFVEGNLPHTLGNFVGFWQSWQEKKKEWFDGKQ